MNKEERERMYKVLTEQWGDCDNLVNDLLHYSKNLQQENKQLEQDLYIALNKIDKAIEYIENTDDFDIEIFNESTGGCLGTDLSKGAKNLLKILGDKEND